MAIAHGSTVEGTTAGTVISLTSVNVTGTDPVLVVTIQYKDNSGGDVVSVVWDSAGVNEALTLIGSEVNGGNANACMWYRAAPTSKTATVTITFSASRRACASASVYTGVDQTNPVRTAAFATGTGTDSSPTCTVVALSGEMVFDSMGQVSAGPDTATADHTQRHNNAATGGGTDTRGCSQEKSSTGASEVMGWTMGGSDDWAICAAPLIEPVAAASDIKTGSSIAIANIKTWSGITDANTKTVSGISNV